MRFKPTTRYRNMLQPRGNSVVRPSMRNNRAGAVATFFVTSYEKYHAQIAGREKGREFTREPARHGVTDRTTLLKRLAVTKLAPAVSKQVSGRIERDFPRAKTLMEKRPV